MSDRNNQGVGPASSVPTAPYPPLMNTRFPSVQLSSIRSTLAAPHHRGVDNNIPASATTSVADAESAAAAADKILRFPSVQFCQWDLVACINVADENATDFDDQKQRHRKPGPLLLELRRLNIVKNHSGSLFDTTTICKSRGNPSLGTTISSTCLGVKQIEQGLPVCATGSSTGALCVHSFSEEDDGEWKSSVEYYHMPRNHRPATAVAWRHPSHVAIGLKAIGSSSDRQSQPSRRPVVAGGPVTSSSSSRTNPADREYCCFVWDVEHQSGITRRSKATPLYKLSHQSGVASLAWILEGGQTLVVGGQHRNLQMYDLRVSAANTAPPITVYAHNFGVHGIQADPSRHWQFASFSRNLGEPVKLWDARRMDSPSTEIKISSSKNNANISSIRWSVSQPGHLSIAVGDSIHEYDTSTSGSRPIHVGTINTHKPVVDFAHYPFADVSKLSYGYVGEEASFRQKKRVFSELFSNRVVAVDSEQLVLDIPVHRIAPIAVSQRTGQVIHTMGRTLWSGSVSKGSTAMEVPTVDAGEDISATMMRRAQCRHKYKYSMDTASNIDILKKEVSLLRGKSTSGKAARQRLIRLWRWIQRVEALCGDAGHDEWDTGHWQVKGLIEAGAMKLLDLDEGKTEIQSFSESLSCSTYDSEGRRAALTSCGWAGMFDLESVMTECEENREFERSSALAVWHGEIGSAVDALQHGAEYYTARPTSLPTSTYAETLQLVSMSIAGYRGGSADASVSTVWRKACANLLQRPDLTEMSRSSTRAAYLRHMLKFLMSIGIDDTHNDVLQDETLSLCDRVAFACRFLSRTDLKEFLSKCISDCQETGNVEGITITGVEKEGIKILQSYVDSVADVQTAALVSSRVVYPGDWINERRVAAEWLHSYRSLLNRWQMWQSRAMFDVDRSELLRKVKLRQTELMGYGKPSSRRLPPPGRRTSGPRNPDPDIQAAIPAQLDARCNYCSSPLGLRRQDTIGNQWLSKMKNVLSCCPNCRKPLPRCSICMLSLGALNPYMELTKDRSRLGPRTSSTSPDNLGTLANLPFAEWFTWCMRCKHGGHAHHLVGWFAKHEVCPVSGCDCECQFDGIHKLKRSVDTQQESLDEKKALTNNTGTDYNTSNLDSTTMNGEASKSN